ncbi:unnamed protein product [Lactuca virosa]|uniref:Uncharacterized protein n=1 Tax=Lactuca virosa TaxID=75947 RepID=A0AAU9LE30_9ASTR|nr:unnamed protein product [Lactuca virosa]
MGLKIEVVLHGPVKTHLSGGALSSPAVTTRSHSLNLQFHRSCLTGREWCKTLYAALWCLFCSWNLEALFTSTNSFHDKLSLCHLRHSL